MHRESTGLLLTLPGWAAATARDGVVGSMVVVHVLACDDARATWTAQWAGHKLKVKRSECRIINDAEYFTGHCTPFEILEMQ